MGKTKKLIELDNKAIELLKKQAELNKRSLKNYLEFIIEERAQELSEPSKAYKALIDATLDKIENNEMKFYSREEIMARYGR